jgi:hypothetical protein
MIELGDPYRTVLFDLAHEGCRTYQQQATWILKKHLEQVIRDQEESLDLFLAADPRALQEVADVPAH